MVLKKGHKGEFWCVFSVAQYGYIIQKKPKKPIYFGFVYFTAFKSQLQKNKLYKNVVEGLKVMSIELKV